MTSLAPVCLVVFTPSVMTAFGPVYRTPKLYLIGLGLILIPSVIMEFRKLVGLMKEK